MIGFALIVWGLIGAEVLITFGMYVVYQGNRRQQIWFIILCGPAVWLMWLFECLLDWFRDRRYRR